MREWIDEALFVIGYVALIGGMAWVICQIQKSDDTDGMA